MSIRKPSRILLVMAALTAMSQIARAGCNCSVPPSPAAYSGAYGGPGGAGMGGYYDGGYGGYGMTGSPGAYGSYGMTGYPGANGNYGMAGYGGMSGYDGLAPVGVPPVAAPGYGYGPGNVGAGVPYNPSGATWAPGGYEARVGSPVYYHDPAGGQYVTTGNPYYDHFGPGFQRHSLHGHYRFPYYNYRAPWYYSGKAVYNRDTNFPW